MIFTCIKVGEVEFLDVSYTSNDLKPFLKKIIFIFYSLFWCLFPVLLCGRWESYVELISFNDFWFEDHIVLWRSSTFAISLYFGFKLIIFWKKKTKSLLSLINMYFFFRPLKDMKVKYHIQPVESYNKIHKIL